MVEKGVVGAEREGVGFGQSERSLRRARKGGRRSGPWRKSWAGRVEGLESVTGVVVGRRSGL